MTPEELRRQVAAACQHRAAQYHHNSRSQLWSRGARIAHQRDAAFWAAEARRHMGVE